MRISGISAHIASDIIKQTDKVRKTENQNNANIVKGKDSAEFSDDSKRLSEIKTDVNTVTTRVNLEPEIRQDRIEDVKAKIKNVYYDSDEFADKLAEKIIKDFGLG